MKVIKLEPSYEIPEIVTFGTDISEKATVIQSIYFLTMMLGGKFKSISDDFSENEKIMFKKYKVLSRKEKRNELRQLEAELGRLLTPPLMSI